MHVITAASSVNEYKNQNSKQIQRHDRDSTGVESRESRSRV